jgi:predicted Zn finger-like uncharacterized protein
MAIELQCPECSGKLKVGDDLLGKKVKCPKCKAIFTATEQVDEIEEEEEKPRSSIRKGQDAVTERPKKRRDDDDDDDDDRPKKKSRRDDDDDDDDDRPKKKSRRDDDDDDDDDRPKKKSRRDDDDDDDDDRPSKAVNPRKLLKSARLAVKLMLIGSIVTLSAVGVMMLLQILALSGAWIMQPDWVGLLLYGLPGLGGAATFLTGLVFAILGPKKGALLGVSIAAVSAGGLHLLFMILSVTIHGGAFFGGRGMGFGMGGSQWNRGTSCLPAFSDVTVYFDAVFFFAGLFEVGTLVLFFLWFRFLKLHYKRYAEVGQSIVGICIAGGAPVVLLLLGLIIRSIASGGLSMTTAQVLMWITFIITNGLVVAVWVFVMLGCIGLGSFLADQRVK